MPFQKPSTSGKSAIDTAPNPNPSSIRRHFESVETELAVPVAVTASPPVRVQQYEDEGDDKYIYNDSISLKSKNPSVAPTNFVAPKPSQNDRLGNDENKNYAKNSKETGSNIQSASGLPSAEIDTTPNPNPSSIRRFFQKSAPSDVKCHACGELVYPTERLCVTEDVIYHKACFRCAVCLQHLTIKTFLRNPVDRSDASVYCKKHVPRIVNAKFDESAIGIRGPLNAQRALKKGQIDLSRHHFDARNLLKKRALKAANNHRWRGAVEDEEAAVDDTGAASPQNSLEAQRAYSEHHSPQENRDWAPRVGIEALHIKTAMDAQKNRTSGLHNTTAKHHYLPDYVHRKQNEILKAQEELELVHRQEEDALLRQFQEQRDHEGIQIQQNIEYEWENQLTGLVQKYEKLIHKKGSNKTALQEQFECEKQVLREQMDEKLITKQRTATLRMRHKEQEETSQMIERHGKQMLELLWNKQREVEQEIEQELMTSAMSQEMASGVSDSSGVSESLLPTQQQNEEYLLQQDSRDQEIGSDISSLSGDYDDATTMAAGAMLIDDQAEVVRILNNIEGASSAPPPPPHPPASRKCDLFIDSSVFSDLDSYVLEVAQTDPESFTKLVHKLMKPCLTDLEKARAIFRWITAKDLNVIDFSSMPAAQKSDTPLGILRAIKMGVETYHTLFRRLCSYAGLNCVEIRGHSKSVGYEPGMHIEPGQFLNTWNAVLLDGDWRLVQCNWGARHLVLNKDQAAESAEPLSVQRNSSNTSKPEDSIRYQQDEHYFLTDPEDFITEFWPFDPKWQLLEDPITLDEFEQLPFVRSVFFHYGMSFIDDLRAVVETDECGGAQVRLCIDPANAADTVFHYQLRFADRNLSFENNYRGIALERFVFQAINGSQVLYKIFVPSAGDYFLEVFANRLPVQRPDTMKSSLSLTNISRSSIDGKLNAATIGHQPFRLKCACKFRIRCQRISQKMHPLPACSPGEWGPAKALRHFGLKASTHPLGAFDCADQVEIHFNVPTLSKETTSNDRRAAEAYDIHARLHMNNIEDTQLERFVTTWREHGMKNNRGDQLVIRVGFPLTGQYGLDIYLRRQPDTNFSHACKYLINVRSVARPDPSLSSAAAASPVAMSDKFGATSAFSELGLRALSHKDTSTVILKSAKPVDIELGFKKPLDFAFHFMRAATFEDLRSRCQMIGPKEAGKNKVIFRLDLTEPGHFLLAIYARKSGNSSNGNSAKQSQKGSLNPEVSKMSMLAMSNVFNYHVICTSPNNNNMPKKS